MLSLTGMLGEIQLSPSLLKAIVVYVFSRTNSNKLTYSTKVVGVIVLPDLVGLRCGGSLEIATSATTNVSHQIIAKKNIIISSI